MKWTNGEISKLRGSLSAHHNPLIRPKFDFSNINYKTIGRHFFLVILVNSFQQLNKMLMGNFSHGGRPKVLQIRIIGYEFMMIGKSKNIKLPFSYLSLFIFIHDKHHGLH